MGNRKLKAAVAFILCLACVVTASAAEKSRIPGIYSDLRYNDEAGDLLGTEIFIVLGPTGYVAFVQVASGAPGPTEVVPVKVEGSSISFTVPEPSFGAGFYEGQITAAGFDGNVTANTQGRAVTTPVNLRRKKSYWQ